MANILFREIFAAKCQSEGPCLLEIMQKIEAAVREKKTSAFINCKNLAFLFLPKKPKK